MQVEANPANPAVTGAIRHAAKVTGANFQYLLATAQVESNFNPNAGASTSSARGLFQFIEQTWLATLKEQGPALGYGRYANAIGRNASGDYVVANPRAYSAIMNLRSDPTANAVMAGAFTRDNTEKLTNALGRKPSEGELYIAHFLGPTGASRLIELATESPRTRAASVFPQAAAANRSIFYGRGGEARSAADVYRTLIGRYDTARGPANAPVAIAAAAQGSTVVSRNTRGAPVPFAPAVTAASRNIKDEQPQFVAAAAGKNAPVPFGAGGKSAPVPFVPVATRVIRPEMVPDRTHAAFAPDTAGLTETYAAAAKLSAPPDPDAGPMFHGLFRTSERREAVAPVVSALWTAPPPPSPPAEPGPVAAASADRSGGPLDLFQEQAPDIRALFRGRV
jgi:hypothetical protein